MAAPATVARRPSSARRAVVFDEANLRENQEWLAAHPVTMHIDEPKTPFVRDLGEFPVDDEDDASNVAGTTKPEQTSTSAGGADHACARAASAAASSAAAAAGGVTTSAHVHAVPSAGASWIEAAYNHVGRVAVQQAPLTFACVAPVGAAHPRDAACDAPPAATAAAAAATTSEAAVRVKRPAVALQIDAAALDPAAQERVEAARKEAEFRAMRAAVYRDEGVNFRERMRLAAAQRANDDDDDEDDDDAPRNVTGQRGA